MVGASTDLTPVSILHRMKGDSRDDMSEEFGPAFQGRLAQWWERRLNRRQGAWGGYNASDVRAPGMGGAAESQVILASLP